MSRAASIPVSIRSASTREYMWLGNGDRGGASCLASLSATINSDNQRLSLMPSRKLSGEAGQASGICRTKPRTVLLTVIRADPDREVGDAALETPRTA